MQGFRYLRWRQAMKRELWALDRHWYGLIGGLWAMDRVTVLEDKKKVYTQKVVDYVASELRKVAEKYIGVPHE